MVNQIIDYKFGPHLQQRINDKNILPEEIEIVLNNEYVLRLPGKDGATKLVLNKTRIKRSLNDPKYINKRKLLRKLYNEGGLTVVLNENTKFIITAY